MSSDDDHHQDCHHLHTCYVAAEHLLQDADESELEVSVGHCIDHRVERRVEITFDVDKCTSVFFEYWLNSFFKRGWNNKIAHQSRKVSQPPSLDRGRLCRTLWLSGTCEYVITKVRWESGRDRKWLSLVTTLCTTTITNHHYHQRKDHQRKKGSQQRRKAPITTPNVTKALCSFRADCKKTEFDLCQAAALGKSGCSGFD